MKQLRERLEHSGVQALSTEELLSLVLRASPASEQVFQHLHTLLATDTSVQDLLKTDFGQLSHEYGLGKARAAQVQALLEIARRLTLPSVKANYQITCAEHAAHLLMPQMVFLDHEELRVLVL